MPDVSGADELQGHYGNPPNVPHNTVFIPLFKRGHISWKSESSVSVLALMMFVVLAFLLLLALPVAWAANSPTWASEFIKIVGQALLIVVGAVIASGVSRSDK